MRYAVTATNVASGAVADTFKTLAAVIAADTAGHRARLVSLAAGTADDTPQDKNVCVRLIRTDNTAAGTPGSSPTPAKLDTDSRASVLTAGINYSAEPTSLESTPVFAVDFNLRGGLLKEWAPDDAPVLNKNQTLCVQAAPRTPNAATLTITLVYEEF